MQQENGERAINLIKAGIYHLCNCNSKVFEFKSKEELQKFLNYYSIQLPKKIKKKLSFPINISLRSDWSYNWEIKEAKDTSFVDKDPIKYIDQVESIYISVIRKHGKEILKNINKKVYVLGKEELTKEVIKFLGLELESSLSKTDYVIGSVIKDLAYYCNSRNSIKVGGYYKTIEGYDLKKVEKILTFLGFDVLGFSKQSRIFTLEDGCIGGVACIPKFINAEPKDITAEIEMLGSKFFPETWEKTDIQELAKKERENSENKKFEGLKEKYYEVLDNLKTSKEYRKQVRNLIIEKLGSVVSVMEIDDYMLTPLPTVTILREVGYEVLSIPCKHLLIMSLPFERVDINKAGEITGITPEGQMKLLTDIYDLCKKEDNSTENKVTTEPTAKREIYEFLRKEVFFSLISTNADRRIRFIFENKHKLGAFFKYFGMMSPVYSNYPICIELTMNNPSSDILYSIGSESSDGRTDINRFIETIDKHVDTILRNYKKVLEKDYQDKIVWSKYCSTIEKKFLDFIGIKHTEKKEEVKGNKGGTTVIRDLVSHAIDGDKDVISDENTSNYFKVMDLLKIDLESREKVREIIDECTGIFSSGNIIKITGEGKYVNILQEILQELKLHITKTPSEIVVSNPISTISNVNVSIYNESAKHIYEEISKEIIKNN